MKLTKRSDSVSKSENQLGLSRRNFMKNTGIAAGGAVVGASMFAPSIMKKLKLKKWIVLHQLKLKEPFVLTVQLAVVFMQKYKMASDRSRTGFRSPI